LVEITKKVFIFLDGSLAGRVRLDDGRFLLFKENYLLEEIGDERVIEVGNVYLLKEGVVVGTIQLENKTSINFFWDGGHLILIEMYKTEFT